MRYLLSNLFVLLIVSCASYPKQNGFTISTEQNFENYYFSDATKDYVYKAKIEAFGNSFGGIFIVKKLKTDHHRIAFTTELGNKIFDFEFEGAAFKVNYILKELDRKVFINILKNDFQVLVKEHPSIEKSFQKNSNPIYRTRVGNKRYYHFLSKQKLVKIVRVNNGTKKVEFTFSGINDNIVQDIQILHENIKLKINLKSILNEK